jgi:murein L,D-transpeptidase YafK
MNTFFKKKLPFVAILILLLIVMVKWSIPQRIMQSPLTIIQAKNQVVSLEKLLPKGTKIAVVIDKSDYQLHIYTADTLVKTYPVVFGGNPIDDKLRQGDRCTPEGTFKIVSKYPHKSWSKFIWINYPTADSWRKHKQAKAEGRIPKDASIGGEIGIHGVPKGSDFMIKTHVNWTLGCISLTNKDIDEIYPFFDKQTTITIQK